MPGIVRFFLIVRPWHPVVAGGLAALVIVAGTLLAAGRVDAVKALAPVCVLQTLAASSGFAGPARRGHYDFVIAAGYKRLWIAIVHWAISAAPGVVGWFLLAAIELASSGGDATTLLTPEALITLWIVSTLPWAATVPLPRLTGGLVWIVMLVARDGFAPDLTLPSMAVAVASAAAMVGAIIWIQRADFPLETAQ